MALLYYVKRIYSLDTLDTRFTVSSKAPLQYTSSEHAVNPSNPALTSDGTSNTRAIPARLPQTQPSRWRTPEYYFYYFCFITIVPLMFKVPYDVSKENDSQYPKFAPRLSKGWIPGRQVDNSDNQYASFRDNIPYMALLVVLHPLLRKGYNLLYPLTAAAGHSQPEEQANSRLKQRVSFDIWFSAVFLIALHGFSSLKVLLIIYINFLLATNLPRKYVPIATWTFNIGVLFANEVCHGYPYAKIAQYLLISPYATGANPSSNWGAWLDTYGGLIPRWEILFNITVLRLISFNLDYYWSGGASSGANALEKKQLDPSALSERDRVAISAPSELYTFVHYLSYVLYSPLYLAGPIVSFNDYISQLRYPSPSITSTRTALYGVRFLLSLLTMEVMLHYIYAVAISKSNPDWAHYTPFQLSMLGYFNLHIIWLKLLLPWRFFRLWALLDGIDPPENMVRCMSDNYSALAFWRGWHRSFNRWIVRYIYIPLGGSGGPTETPQAAGKLYTYGRALVNMLLVFTFVALWHDISLTLLTWSWLIVLFFLPEIICTHVLFPKRAYVNKPNTYRVLCGVGAVGNILMMMAANLVGFALGLDGLKHMVSGIVSGWEGWVFLVMAGATLFVGTMVMFEVREEEARKGIRLKC